MQKNCCSEQVTKYSYLSDQQKSVVILLMQCKTMVIIDSLLFCDADN